MATPHTQPAPSARYLVLYNALSALLRAALLLRTLHLWTASGTRAVWDALHGPARWAETAAAIEVAHAALGLVRASPATAALQIAGRNTIVWAIARNYPAVAARAPAYACMLVVWNAADVLRYAYYLVDRGTGPVARGLAWLRYNAFIVLYPVGIVSEMWLVYRVIEPSRARNPMYQYLLWFGLLIYAPAFYVLYGHMLAQRRRRAGKQSKRL